MEVGKVFKYVFRLNFAIDTPVAGELKQALRTEAFNLSTLLAQRNLIVAEICKATE